MSNTIRAGRHRGELAAALAAMGFGSAYVATSFALRGFDPLPAAAWRAFFAALLLAGLVGAGRRRRGRLPTARVMPPLRARIIRTLALAVLGGPLFLAAMNLAVAHVGATITAFVAGLYAVLAAVLAPIVLRERLAARALVGFVVALAGTAMLAELDPGRSDIGGIGWGLVAATAFALYLVLARRWSGAYRLDPTITALAITTMTCLVLAAVVLATGAGSLIPADPPLESLIAMAWLAFVAAVATILAFASTRLISAARTAGFLLLNPITATILAAVLLGERASAMQLLGGALVLLGMAAATMPLGRVGSLGASRARSSG